MQKYRPDIDGLRAVAVLAVIVYHAFPHRVSGGFIGVDVFFVISGYLISGILLDRASTGVIGFLDFYRRRISRIFPSLALVLLTVIAVGSISLFPKEFHELGADVASGATFSANFSLMGEAGYFDRSAAVKPLLHLWSLAIEEQFYILWPLLLWGMKRSGGKRLVWLGAFSALSFAWNLIVATQDPVADFYSPFTRCWELSLGGFLAAYEREAVAKQISENMRNIFSVCGAAAVAVAMFALSSDHFPGLVALLPVLGSAALLAAGASACINRRMLANPILCWIGTISYPLYLWHWPLLAFARILLGETPSALLRIELMAAAFLLAVLTHYLVENPLRFGAYPRWKTSVALAGMCIAAGLGQYVFLQHGLPQRAVVARNPALFSGDAGGPGPFVAPYCNVSAWRRPQIDGCFTDTREAPRYAVIGDSKAGVLAPALVRTSHSGGRWMYLGNNDGKGRYLSTTLLSPSNFPREYPLTREMLDAVEAQPAIHSVVIANAARNLYGLKDETTLEHLGTGIDQRTLSDAFDRVITELIAHGRRVYLVVDNPTLGHPEDCIGRVTSVPILNEALSLPTHPRNCTIAYSRFMQFTKPYRAMLATLRTKHPSGLEIVPTADIFCDIRADVCPMFRRNRLLYGFTDHPSDYASGFIAARINIRIARHERAEGTQ